MPPMRLDRKSTRLNSSHLVTSYAVFCLKKKKRARFAQDADAGDRRGDIEREVRAAEPHRHLQHQIAVGAKRLHRQLPQIASEGRLLAVHQRDEHLGADVARAPAAPPLRRGHESQLAPYRVKGAVAVGILAVGGVEGPEQPLAVTVGTVSEYLGKRVHLEIQGTR